MESAHIVQIFDSGTGPTDRPYLVMELLQGEDLRARLGAKAASRWRKRCTSPGRCCAPWRGRTPPASSTAI